MTRTKTGLLLIGLVALIRACNAQGKPLLVDYIMWRTDKSGDNTESKNIANETTKT